MIILNTENKLKLEIIYNVISSIIYDYRVTLNLSARYRIEFSCDKGIVSAVFLDNDEEVIKCDTFKDISFYKMFYGFVNGIIIEYAYNDIVIEQEHKIIATIKI
jgi:hypothetical protein